MTGTQIPWLCDSMDDSATKAFGGTYNGEFVLDPDGKIVRQRFWSNPRTLRADLTELVGEVESPTKIKDLPVRFRPEPREVASGVVEPIKLPRGLTPIKIKYLPLDNERPLFVKLRAELTPRKNAKGKYQMFLGFYPDPIHKVHWNNLAGRIRVSFDAPAALGITAEELEGPKVDEDSDVDPRMFLIDLASKESSAGRREPIKISLKYVICDDAETFCFPVTQQFEVTTEPLGNGSTRPGIFLVQMFKDVRKLDKDGDGKITAEELGQGNVTLYMTHIDYNLDNVIDEDELKRFDQMYNNGRGFE
ncbi:MAG: hypothetical protein AAF483_15235 [Planctomycetota bacterium]